MASRKPEHDVISEYDAALRQGLPRAAVFILLAVAALFVAFVSWANWAKLDEITRGDGRVIPSSKTQLLQSLEGGIVKELLVRAGDRVKRGDILARIDDTGFSSNLGEVNAKLLALEATITRLRHEAEGDLQSDPAFSEALAASSKALVENERRLFAARRQSLDTQIGILKERVEQRQREMEEAKATMKRHQDAMRLANEEMKIKKPLAARNIVSKTDIIKLQRDIAESDGQIKTLTQSMTRIEASIREAEGVVREQEQKFRQDARTGLTQAEAEFAVALETVRGAKDRVARADVRAPLDGIVNKLNANTVGGVVQAGQTIMEIVPIEDSLFVEAKIRPADIAFVHPGQAAVVKITAYDFSIYGGLEGEVELISADSVYDEALRESFYLVTIKTLQSQLTAGKADLPIIPGMVASVDILTGKKSVLEYLLKPINKARQEALTER